MERKESNPDELVGGFDVPSLLRGVDNYVLTKRFEVQLRKYHVWRRGFWLYVEGKLLVVEAKNGAAEHSLNLLDISTVRCDQKIMSIVDRNRRAVLIRLADGNDAETRKIYKSIRAVVGAAHDQETLTSRFALAKRMFRDLDLDGSGTLDVREARSLFDRLPAHIPSELISRKLNSSAKAGIDEKEFLEIFKVFIESKATLVNLFHLHAGEDQVMTKRELTDFLMEVQGETASHAESIASHAIASSSLRGKLEQDAFIDFILSKDNAVINPEETKKKIDMKQPITNYFIASSHNTYLEGNQITGSVSAVSYINTIEAGARCVEMDLWEDDEGEPTITHGRTLTGEVKFRDVVNQFSTSKNVIFKPTTPYPLVLSFEDHLTLRSRQRMVKIMQDNPVFWSMLYIPKESEDPEKLSPEDLRNKILIKMKIKKETPAELSRLIFIPGGKYKGSWDEAMEKPPLTCFSHDESRLQQFIDEDEGEKVVAFNAHHLSRIYPSGKRVGSSNFDPSPAWLVTAELFVTNHALARKAAPQPTFPRADSITLLIHNFLSRHGCQLVALNYQTIDKHYIVNRTFFEMNAGSGYLLKPPRLLGKVPLDTQTLVEVRILHAQGEPAASESDAYISAKATCCHENTKYKATRTTSNGITMLFPHAADPDLPPYKFEVHSKEVAVLILALKWQSNQRIMKRTNRMYAVIPIGSMRQGYRKERMVSDLEKSLEQEK